MEIIEITFGQKLALLFFTGLVMIFAATCYEVRRKSYKDFDSWLSEVIYFSEFYGFREDEIFEEEIWEEYYEEGLSPEKALKEYLVKKN